ncbi:hypothetical protein D917_03624, partial [Trichinella nativa]
MKDDTEIEEAEAIWIQQIQARRIWQDRHGEPQNCRSAAGDRESGTLMAGQLEAAEQIRVRIAQRQCFRGEIDALRTNGCVGAQSRLRQLRPLCLKIRQLQRPRLRT